MTVSAHNSWGISFMRMLDMANDICLPIPPAPACYGLLRLPPEAAALRLAALAVLLRPMRVLPFDSECALHAARIRVELEAVGTPIGLHDRLIAAMALRYQAPLVTRNVREFSRVQGLQWLNWHETE